MRLVEGSMLFPTHASVHYFLLVTDQILISYSVVLYLFSFGVLLPNVGVTTGGGTIPETPAVELVEFAGDFLLGLLFPSPSSSTLGLSFGVEVNVTGGGVDLRQAFSSSTDGGGDFTVDDFFRPNLGDRNGDLGGFSLLFFSKDNISVLGCTLLCIGSQYGRLEYTFTGIFLMNSLLITLPNQYTQKCGVQGVFRQKSQKLTYILGLAYLVWQFTLIDVTIDKILFYDECE